MYFRLMGREDSKASSLSLKRIRFSIDFLLYRFGVDEDLSLSNIKYKKTSPIRRLYVGLISELFNHHRGKNNNTNSLTDQVLSVLATI